MTFKNALLFSAAIAGALTLLGCSDKGAETETTQTPVVSDPVIAAINKGNENVVELVATSAFDTPAPIARIAFSPNDVASWLGTVGMLSTAGHFYTTSIEGEPVNLISEDKHIDVVGLDRPGAPGMFLTVMNDGSLRSYIESDDTFGYKQAYLSDDVGLFIGLCRTSSEVTDQVTLVTENYTLETFSVQIDENTLMLSPKDSDKNGQKNLYPMGCAIDVNHQTLQMNTNAAQFTLISVNGALEAKQTIIAKSISKKSINLVSGKDRDFVAMLGIGDGLTPVAMSGEPVKTMYLERPHFELFATDSFDSVGEFRIERGLSIAGLSRARTIASTSSPFGGSGFNDGVVALADAEENRVVILSRSYLLDNIPDQ